MDLNDIARAIAPAGPLVRFRQGTVTAVAANGDLTVTIAGSATAVAAVKSLSSVCPRIGSAVWLVTDGVDLFAFGTIQPTGPASCSILRGTDGSIANDTATTISLTATATVEWDTHGFFAAGSPDQLTIPVPGVYLLTASLAWAANATGYRSLSIDVAGASIATQRWPAAAGGVLTFQQVSAVCKLAAGDLVQMTLRQLSTASLNFTANAHGPRLSASWLRGPT